MSRKGDTKHRSLRQLTPLQLEHKRWEKVKRAKERELRDSFIEWKRELKGMIDESVINVQPEGNAIFVLSPRLVRLIWQVTIKERIKIEMEKDAEGAEERAIDGLRDEVVKGAKKLKEQAEQELHRALLEAQQQQLEAKGVSSDECIGSEQEGLDRTNGKGGAEVRDSAEQEP